MEVYNVESAVHPANPKVGRLRVTLKALIGSSCNDPVFAELEDMAGKNTSIPTSSILLLNPASFFDSEDDGIL